MSVGIRLYWQPPVDDDVARYEIYASADKDSPPLQIATVAHVVPGPNYQTKAARFFYDDLTGTPDTWYQILAVATSGVCLSDSGLFQPEGPFGGSTAARVAVDHNYPEPDNLRFVTQAGVGIPDADIRVYFQADYEGGKRETPLYVVKTREDGRWDRPLLLEPGLTYVLLFVKTSAFASDPITLMV